MNKHFTLLLFIGLVFWGCEDNSQVDCAGVEDGNNICGCTDSSAANYNPNATYDDGSCSYGLMDFEPEWYFLNEINSYKQIAIGKGYSGGYLFSYINLTQDITNYSNLQYHDKKIYYLNEKNLYYFDLVSQNKQPVGESFINIDDYQIFDSGRIIIYAENLYLLELDGSTREIGSCGNRGNLGFDAIELNGEIKLCFYCEGDGIYVNYVDSWNEPQKAFSTTDWNFSGNMYTMEISPNGNFIILSGKFICDLEAMSVAEMVDGDSYIDFTNNSERIMGDQSNAPAYTTNTSGGEPVVYPYGSEIFFRELSRGGMARIKNSNQIISAWYIIDMGNPLSPTIVKRLNSNNSFSDYQKIQ